MNPEPLVDVAPHHRLKAVVQALRHRFGGAVGDRGLDDQIKAAADTAKAQLSAAQAQADVARNASGYAVLLADSDGVVVETLAESVRLEMDLRLEAAAAHRHAQSTDGGLTAAFTGVPDVTFQIDDAAASTQQSWFDLQLEAGRGAWWSTAFRYRWSAVDALLDRGWWLEFERKL